ncbi:hypothetical protein B0H10DRAFT_2060742, partial [Mycena sp. CBHHK59/15]
PPSSKPGLVISTTGICALESNAVADVEAVSYPDATRTSPAAVRPSALEPEIDPVPGCSITTFDRPICEDEGCFKPIYSRFVTNMGRY